jgi:riboflavin kinase/FMN adenylyltransferase
MLNGLGVDIFYLVDFTLDFAVLSPKQFVDSYLLKLEVTHAVAGFDFSYGFMGAGKLHHTQSSAAAVTC